MTLVKIENKVKILIFIVNRYVFKKFYVCSFNTFAGAHATDMKQNMFQFFLFLRSDVFIKKLYILIFLRTNREEKESLTNISLKAFFCFGYFFENLNLP